MKSLKFIPYEQVGDLIFGMEREVVKEKCGQCLSSCMYGYPVEDRYLDDYGHMHTLCNNKQRLEAIELFPDISTEEFVLEYNGEQIYLNKEVDALVQQLEKITDDLTEDEDEEGYSSLKLGLKIYCPEDIVEDVIIHDRYCYEEEQEYIREQGLDIVQG